MTSTPDIRLSGTMGAALAALALFAAAPPLAASQAGAAAAMKEGREALMRGDGVAAEISLRRALDEGAARPAVAAWMGEAYLQQGDFGAAREWLGPGQFTPASRVQGFHMLARLEMSENNLPAAGKAFDRALEGNEGTAELWVDIGRMRYRGGEHHQALEAANEALERDAKNPRALEFRGQIARDAQGLVAALPWFERGLRVAPEDLGLMGEYAATLGEIGRAKDMLRITRKMIELDGENPRAFYLQAVLAARAGDYNLARRLLYRTEDNFDEIPAAMMLEGVLEMRAGNWALAVEAFDELARREPGNERISWLLGRAMLENGDAAEVVARYRVLADRQDASPYLLMLVGRALEQVDDRAGAATYLDRAAQAPAASILPLGVGEAGELALFRFGSDPYRVDAAVPKIRKLLAAGNVAEANATVAMLAERYPGSAYIEVLAGDVALAQGDAKGALRSYASSARIRSSFTLVTRMAAALRLDGRDADARKLLTDYLKQHPQDGEAAEYLGQLAARAGDWKRAKTLLEYARILRDGGGRDPLLFATLAEAQLQLGDGAAALADAEGAFRMQRSSPAANLALARVLDSAGRKAEARALLAKAQRLSRQ